MLLRLQHPSLAVYEDKRMASGADASAHTTERSKPIALEVLLFELSNERFGLPLDSVLEVVRAVALRSLPNAPPIVEGIIDVHGEIVPVLDIRARFGLPARPIALSDHFVLALAGARRIGLRVDRALGLGQLQSLSMERAINLPRGIEHIAGVASLPDGIVLLHDLTAFLSVVETERLDSALPGGVPA
jgi:purine-binding chemotaxis protein CheW